MFHQQQQQQHGGAWGQPQHQQMGRNMYHGFEHHHIRNLGGNDLVLDVADDKNEPGAKVIVYNQKQPIGPNQLWRLEHVDNKKFFIVSALNPELVLDVYEGKAKAGQKVEVWTRKHPPQQNQLWEWENQSIHSALGHDLMLDVTSDKAGHQVTVETRKNKPHQNWRLENF